MDIFSILFIISFSIIGFCIVYNVLVHGAWHNYYKIDEQILDLKGEEVEATLESYEKDPNRKNCYKVKMRYVDSFGEIQFAYLASYNIIRKDELRYIKSNQPLRALAYKDLMEIDLSEVSTHEKSLGLISLLIIKQILPVFSKRCGFPPKNPRKKFLKELKGNVK